MGRGAGAMFAAALLLVAPVAMAQRIGPAPLPPDARVAGPRLGYPALAPDTRVTLTDELDAPPDAIETPAETAARLAAIARELGQDYAPRPAIWRIADRDTTIYLFGTIHVLPPGFQWRSPALERVVAQADRLLLESVDDGGAGDPLALPVAPGAPERRPLIDRAAPADRALLAQFMATLPAGARTMIDAMPTWVAAAAISFAREVRSGDVRGPGADDWLEARFRQAGKPVEGIEAPGRVIADVNAVSEAAQQAMLGAALRAPQRDLAQVRAPLHAWARGDMGSNGALSVDLNRATGTGALTEPLLLARNRDWADKLVARLRRPGVTLFAAGAAHFIGAGSVIELLRRRGIRVERVD